jgi:hypothetical protein
MGPLGQIFPSEVWDRVFPVIHIAFPFTTLTCVAQPEEQFKQDVNTHFSSSPSLAFFFGMKAALAPADVSPRPAATPVPTNPANLRKARRLIFNGLCSLLPNLIAATSFLKPLPGGTLPNSSSDEEFRKINSLPFGQVPKNRKKPYLFKRKAVKAFLPIMSPGNYPFKKSGLPNSGFG